MFAFLLPLQMCHVICVSETLILWMGLGMLIEQRRREPSSYSSSKPEFPRKELPKAGQKMFEYPLKNFNNSSSLWHRNTIQILLETPWRAGFDNFNRNVKFLKFRGGGRKLKKSRDLWGWRFQIKNLNLFLLWPVNGEYKYKYNLRGSLHRLYFLLSKENFLALWFANKLIKLWSVQNVQNLRQEFL